MLPAWWTRRGRAPSGRGDGGPASLSVHARAAGQAFTSSSRIGLDQVVGFDWEVALEGKTITRRELAALAKPRPRW